MDLFDRQAASYDAWYDTAVGQAVFCEECDALYPLLGDLPRPWLEVGVGTGRFAEGLAVEFGIDPSLPALAIASRRHLRVVAARGEALPFSDHTFGAVVLVATLCFVRDPFALLAETRRVLQPKGGIVFGIIPADGPWGEHYQQLAAQGHLYYRHAHFFGRPEFHSLLAQSGFRPTRTRSALLWPPHGQPSLKGTVIEGDDPRAGFLAVLAIP